MLVALPGAIQQPLKSIAVFPGIVIFPFRRTKFRTSETGGERRRQLSRSHRMFQYGLHTSIPAFVRIIRFFHRFPPCIYFI